MTNIMANIANLMAQEIHFSLGSDGDFVYYIAASIIFLVSLTMTIIRIVKRVKIRSGSGHQNLYRDDSNGNVCPTVVFDDFEDENDTQEASQAKAKYCIYCGEPLTENAKFCENCGARTTE